MPSSIRQLVAPLAIALVCSVAVAVIVVAGNRPAILVASPSSSTSSSSIEPAVLATGEATVSTRPDLATVYAGVESQQGTAAGAQSDLATKAGKLISRIKSLGVADKDLSTTGYWIGPNYASDGQTITGYRANEELVIQWHNVDTVGKTLDAIVQEGGATNIGVGFGLADPKAAQAEARAEAIGDAKSKAQAMATAAGVKLGQALRVSDVSSQSPVFYGGAAAAPAQASTQVPVGQLSISVTVEVDFAIA